MSKATTPDRISEIYDEMVERCLRAHGWTYGMWRCYWVWRKETHDASFMCMSSGAAIGIESVLQSTAEYYPAPKPKEPAA